MPELPEVETIKRQLEKKVTNKTIKKVEILDRQKMAALFLSKDKIEGKRIVGIERRAKVLIIALSNKYYLVTHLKMTGSYIFNQHPIKHTRCIFHLHDGSRLLFNDIRRFGWIKLVDENDLNKMFAHEKYGIEPLSKEFTQEKFKELLEKKPKAKIKVLLMDQSFLAGVGNIYVQETCFYAKIDPRRKAGDLNDSEVARLYEGLIKILNEAIKYKGTSSENYVDIEGKQGGYESLLKVYGRKGKDCIGCKGKVEKIKLGGRGTFFCPKCQK